MRAVTIPAQRSQDRENVGNPETQRALPWIYTDLTPGMSSAKRHRDVGRGDMRHLGGAERCASPAEDEMVS
jgi:hypothetical protein